MFDTPRHCRRVWSMCLRFKNALPLDVSVSFLFLQSFTILLFISRSNGADVQMSNVLKYKKNFVRTCTAFSCFIHDGTWRKHSWFPRSVFLSSCVWKKIKINNHHPTVKIVYDRTTLCHSCCRRRSANEHVGRPQRDEGFNTPGTCSPLVINNLRY